MDKSESYETKMNDKNKKETAAPETGKQQLPQNNDTYSVFQRVLAILALLFFLGTFIVLVITLATDKDRGKILACLFVLMVIPCIFYLFQWFTKLHRDGKI